MTERILATFNLEAHEEEITFQADDSTQIPKGVAADLQENSTTCIHHTENHSASRFFYVYTIIVRCFPNLPYYMRWKVFGLPMKKTFILFFNIILLKRDALFPTILLHFDTLGTKRFVKTCKISFRFQCNLNFFFMESSFQVWKQIAVAWSQFWRIPWVEK